MMWILLAGFLVAILAVSTAIYRWAAGLRDRAPQDLTVEEYRRVHETASSRPPTD